MYYVQFNQDDTVQQCYIAGISGIIPTDAESVSKEEFDKYCTRQYRKGTDGQPEKIISEAPTMAELKTAKWSEIRAKRDTLEQSGVPYMGKVIDSDTVSVQRIAIAVQAAQAAISAGVEFTLEWTCADNSILTMTAEQVVGMSVALAQYSDSLHQTARGLREQIEAAETAEDLTAIVWPEQTA